MTWGRDWVGTHYAVDVMLQWLLGEGGFEQGSRDPASLALTNRCNQHCGTWEQDHPFHLPHPLHQREEPERNRLCSPTHSFCHPAGSLAAILKQVTWVVTCRCEARPPERAGGSQDECGREQRGPADVVPRARHPPPRPQPLPAGAAGGGGGRVGAVPCHRPAQPGAGAG